MLAVRAFKLDKTMSMILVVHLQHDLLDFVNEHSAIFLPATATNEARLDWCTDIATQGNEKNILMETIAVPQTAREVFVWRMMRRDWSLTKPSLRRSSGPCQAALHNVLRALEVVVTLCRMWPSHT